MLALTQGGFAERYNVDDSTVSRWERGVMEPSPAVLAKIQEVAAVRDPIHSHNLVKASPVFKFLAPMARLAEPIIISRGAARMLSAKVSTLRSTSVSLRICTGTMLSLKTQTTPTASPTL